MDSRSIRNEIGRLFKQVLNHGATYFRLPDKAPNANLDKV